MPAPIKQHNLIVGICRPYPFSPLYDCDDKYLRFEISVRLAAGYHMKMVWCLAQSVNSIEYVAQKKHMRIFGHVRKRNRECETVWINSFNIPPNSINYLDETWNTEINIAAECVNNMHRCTKTIQEVVCDNDSGFEINWRDALLSIKSESRCIAEQYQDTRCALQYHKIICGFADVLLNSINV